jgi:oxygen-independent coproporphyrinogen-3 oxidase
LASYLGLGSSAASTLIATDTVLSITQDQNLKTYSESKDYSGYTEETLAKSEYLEEFLMMALRTDEGIDKAGFSSRFGIDFDQTFTKTIQSLEKSWTIDSPQLFALTEKGMMVLDDIVLRFALAI